MIGDDCLYEYLSEKAPLEKINYSYSKFHGQDFVDAWLLSREKSLTNSEVNLRLQDLTLSKTAKMFVDWAEKIDIEFNSFDDKLKLMVKRFEVTKRVYSDYNNEFRPIENKEFECALNYLLFSSILIKVYLRTKQLPYLNALLKSNDICCSLNSLTEKELNIRNSVLQQEKNIVLSLIKTLK